MFSEILNSVSDARVLFALQAIKSKTFCLIEIFPAFCNFIQRYNYLLNVYVFRLFIENSGNYLKFLKLEVTLYTDRL